VSSDYWDGTEPVPPFHLPRLDFDLLCPRRARALIAAVPPPRLKFVALGFFPALRRVPGLWPGRAPERVRAPRLSLFGSTNSDLFLCDMAKGQRRFFLRPPFRPPLRDAVLLSFFPRPLPLFFPPRLSLFTVAQARRDASFLLTPRFL
jgi:hypothetical protein